MPKFIIAYLGGDQPETPAAGAAHMEKWKAWLADLGEAVINPGTPLVNSNYVSAAGVTQDGGANPMSGFSVISAKNMAAALDMAKACPFLGIGGTLHVAEMKEM